MRVLIFGASITQGFWDSQGGWVHRLRKYYDDQKISGENDDPPTVFNLGVSGDSTNELLERFQPETKARKSDQNLVIVFAIGTNDSRTKSGKNFSDVQTYARNLQELAAQANRYTDKILFVEIAPCVEERSNPVAWGNTGYTNQRISEFNSSLIKFCQQNSFPLVKVFDVFFEKQKTIDMMPDGVHPNDDGHQLIYKLVLPELNKLIYD